MNRSTPLAFLAVLFAFAVPANAQNCSTAYESALTTSAIPPDQCSGVSEDINYSVIASTTAYCASPSGTSYATSTLSVYGNGMWICSNLTSLDLNCPPTFSGNVTTATSPTDYNRFYLYAYDGSGYCTNPTTPSRQAFWQCQGLTCTGTGGDFCNGAPCPPGCTPKDNWCSGNSPIILDVDGKGFFLTSAAGGVKFDISGTGNPIQMGWTAQGAGNAFLALPGADGLVDNGKQLFGNFTSQPPSQNPNGFAALAVYDLPGNGGNGNGMIDPGDAIFSSLRLWIDANHDGICQPEELHTLLSLGVTSISLKYTYSPKVDQYGNAFRYKAGVDIGDPDPSHVGRTAYDVFFASLPTTTAKNLVPLRISPSVQACPVPVQTKRSMLSPSDEF